jgi:hypothetical protein
MKRLNVGRRQGVDGEFSNVTSSYADKGVVR